jgi:hypothetical protein
MSDKPEVEAAAAPPAPIENAKVTNGSDAKDAPAPPAAEETKADEKPSKPEAPAATTPSTGGPTWPEIGDDHPISLLLKELPALLKETEYDEVYGIKLDPTGPFHTKLILQKFLRGNANDVEKAKEQLKGTLKWRKDFGPSKAMEETFPKERFGGLGYVTVLEGVPGSPNKTDICTFNIYGAVKNNEATFGNIDE